MWRRAVLSGSVVLCALSAMATGENPEVSVSWARDPYDAAQHNRGWERPRPVIPPIGRPRSDIKEYAIPSGGGRCYTGIVIVPAAYGGSQRFRFNDGHSDFPITVQAGQTFVLPFASGWRPDCPASISGDLCDGDFEAWAITERGPVRLELCRN